MPTFASDGLQLHYRDEGRGRPVVLLHGFPLDGESFRPQIAGLSHRYRFLVPDHRGFGQSPRGGGISEMSRIAQDVLALLDALELPSAVVGGVSMGGYAAIALLREDPSRVQALVLADTQHTADDEAGRLRREETALAVEREGMVFLAGSMLPKLLSPNAPEAIRRGVDAQIRGNDPAGVAAASRGMALRTDGRDILPRFGGPTLVVVGEQDAVTPPAKARALAALIPSAQTAIIPGAGHLANQEAPEAFNQILDEFLARRMND